MDKNIVKMNEGTEDVHIIASYKGGINHTNIMAGVHGAILKQDKTVQTIDDHSLHLINYKAISQKRIGYLQ